MEFSIRARVQANLWQTSGYSLGLGSVKCQARVQANQRFGFGQTLDLGSGKPWAWVWAKVQGKVQGIVQGKVEGDIRTRASMCNSHTLQYLTAFIFGI